PRRRAPRTAAPSRPGEWLRRTRRAVSPWPTPTADPPLPASRTGTAATTGPSRPAEAPPVPPVVSGRCPPAPEPRRRYYKPRAAGPPPASAARAHAEVGGRAAAGVPGTVVGAGGVGGFGTPRLGAAPEAAGSSRALLLVGG